MRHYAARAARFALHADERSPVVMSDAVSVIDESKIVTHDRPAWRERSNYMVRVDLTADGMPGHYEQLWTRTDDELRHEVCCIPFFTYGLSLGDVITVVDSTGAYRVESKSGHRTIRIAVQDPAFAHEQHEKFHANLARVGALIEFRGHALGYCGVDIVNQRQSDDLVESLRPLVEDGTLVWEWADPAVRE